MTSPPPPPSPGPSIRTDVIDVYVFRRAFSDPVAPVHFLQIRRTRTPMRGTWQPVMGHIEPGERALDTAVRELHEELGLAPAAQALLGLYQLEQTYPYFLAEIDQIVLSPRFAAEVAPFWEPTLNAEHDAARWVAPADVESAFMWPGQIAALREIQTHILNPAAPARPNLRLR